MVWHLIGILVQELLDMEMQANVANDADGDIHPSNYNVDGDSTVVTAS